MGAERLLISVRIGTRLSRLRRWVPAVFDTGSPDSMIGYRDALSIQVRGSVLSKKSRKEIKAGVVHFGAILLRQLWSSEGWEEKVASTLSRFLC